MSFTEAENPQGSYFERKDGWTLEKIKDQRQGGTHKQGIVTKKDPEPMHINLL